MFIVVLALLGACGSTTHARPKSAWCPKMTLLTGKGAPSNEDTVGRVGKVNARYQRQILRDCPGAVSVGVSTAAIMRAEQQGKPLPPAGKPKHTYYVIAVGVSSKKYLPTQAVFLKGVPLLFQVEGPAHLVNLGSPRSGPTTAQRSTSWPFTPEQPVTRQSNQDHVPPQATVLRISWTGGQRQPITVTNASQVQRVAHILGELPKESLGACAERFIYGPPTVEFAFRTPTGQVLATAS